MGLTAISLDPQSVLADRREMRAAGDERDVDSGLGERGAIGPADPSGANHCDAHAILRAALLLRGSAEHIGCAVLLRDVAVGVIR